MLFNSITFVIFLPIVFFIYWSWICNSVRKRNIFLICAGFVFYGWWDIRFLFLLISTAMIDYYVSHGIEKAASQRKKKILLSTSLVCNLGVLFFFKYYNFFADSFIVLLGAFGLRADFFTLSVILPIGLSFYTFQALSYTIDVYRNKIKPAPNVHTYMAYISFFPQLVAGPIESAGHLMPQFGSLKKISYEQIIAGLRLMLWGYFKKCVIADNMAPFANSVFSADANPNAAGVILGTIAFAIQVYGDFSGYSDIAKGSAHLLGFDLMYNFRYPYFASSMRDYWRRWHISLSNWLNDYLYMPFVIAKRDWGNLAVVIGLLLTFSISGLWHGANWTFIIWGVWHGLALVIENFYRQLKLKRLPSFLNHLLVVAVVLAGYVFFRSPDIHTTLDRFAAIGEMDLDMSRAQLFLSDKNYSSLFISGLIVLTALMFIAEWFAFKNKFFVFFTIPKVYRLAAYYFLLIAFLFYGVYHEPPAFIYFQF